MRKQVIAIIAVVVAIIVILAVALGIKDKQDEKKLQAEQQKIVEELGVSGGVEESNFDENSFADDDSNVNKNTENADNDANGNSDKTAQNSNNDQSSTSNNKEDSDKDNGSATKPAGKTDYEKFHAMSPADQQAYMESFGSVEKFFKWYNKAKEQYEKENPAIEIDGDSVDLGDL